MCALKERALINGGSTAGEGTLVNSRFPHPAIKMTDDTGGCAHTAFKPSLCSKRLRPGDVKMSLHQLKKENSRVDCFWDWSPLHRTSHVGESRACGSFLAYRKPRL